MIAVKANMTSARGEVINELPDRISDTVIFAGIALSGHANALVTCWVIFGMLLVSYIGVLGKAVGAKRQYGGIMPKPNRMFILAAACWIRFFLPGHAPGTAMTVVDIANGLMLAGLAQTAIVRTRAIFRELAILEGKRTA
jgi:phosphatidylglycerophosphate synthase